MGWRGTAEVFILGLEGKKHVEVARPRHFFKDCFRSNRVCVLTHPDGMYHLEQVRPITMSVTSSGGRITLTQNRSPTVVHQTKTLVLLLLCFYDNSLCEPSITQISPIASQDVHFHHLHHLLFVRSLFVINRDASRSHQGLLVKHMANE